MSTLLMTPTLIAQAGPLAFSPAMNIDYPLPRFVYVSTTVHKHKNPQNAEINSGTEASHY